MLFAENQIWIQIMKNNLHRFMRKDIAITTNINLIKIMFLHLIKILFLQHVLAQVIKQANKCAFIQDGFLSSDFHIFDVNTILTARHGVRDKHFWMSLNVESC